MSNNFSKIQGRFRMWKSGKRWLYAGAIVILASVGLAVGGNKILGPNGNANEQRLSMVDIGDSKRNLPTSDSVEPYLSDLSGNNDNRQISGESGERYLSGLSGNNSGHRLLGASGEGHVTLEKLPDISKEGLHIPELPQHSPELGGSNRTPLPGLEGDNHTGDSGLSGRNHTPLPSLEGDNPGPKLSESSSEEGWKTGYEIGYLDGYRGFGKAPIPDPDYERGYFEGRLARKQSHLEGRNNHPLPGKEGESGESHAPNLSGNNGGDQLPGESGESQVPNLSGNNGHRPLPGESGETHLPNLSGNNGDHQLPGESGESHVPNLSGNNGGHQLPGESGERHLPSLSGNNGGHQLPGESSESKLPDLSGNNGDRQLPGESGNDDWPSFVELGYEHGRVDYNNGSFIEWEIGWRIEL
ncbi:KxYKxGKxW signal peptide domain-containing protein [Streptococcus suis]|nr:KxYKxGKxW signal peptide domain-containing protein [Streptococcus suis]